LRKIRSIKAKTLIVHGKKDPVINVKNSYLMNSLIPNSELIVIDNMRHLIEEEILDQIKNKLLEHLAQS
jgi:pimeloyl-ACP methyl ester carboxylesterase